MEPVTQQYIDRLVAEAPEFGPEQRDIILQTFAGLSRPKQVA
jgi:hypothetical protein